MLHVSWADLVWETGGPDLPSGKSQIPICFHRSTGTDPHEMQLDPSSPIASIGESSKVPKDDCHKSFKILNLRNSNFETCRMPTKMNNFTLK